MRNWGEVSRQLDQFIEDGSYHINVRDRDSEGSIWQDRIRTFLRRVWGEQSEEYRIVFGSARTEWRQQVQRLIESLRVIKDRVDRSEYGDAENLRESPREVTASVPVKVFLAHSGASPAFYRLTQFVQALGCEPMVSEWLPYSGRTVPEQARHAMDGCAVAVIFFEREHGHGILPEIGILQEKFDGKVIYCVEEGIDFDTPMLNPYARESFKQDNLERVLHRIVVELRNWGFLRTAQA